MEALPPKRKGFSQRAQGRCRLLVSDAAEPQQSARPCVRKSRKVGGDDAADLGVAARGLAIVEQHNRLSVAGNLNGARRHAIADDASAARTMLQGRAGEP